MNQKTSKLIRKFIKKGNPDLNADELNKLIEMSKKKYNTLTSKEREEFKKRIK